MSRIHADEKSVRELLSNVKYDIDSYQREYEWERHNIEALLDDLVSKFTANHATQHERGDVRNYQHYFLGTIITINKDKSNLKYIVDGQQRLTTVTLLLILIHHIREGGVSAITDVTQMIRSESYGEMSFNISVSGRDDCMKALFERGRFDATEHPDLSVRNLSDRYADIQELFPGELPENSLPYFVDWLTRNVDLVEIEASTDDDAFTIFETVNDRGINLGQVDILKSYLLANIRNDNEKRVQANKVWRERIVTPLIDLGTETKTRDAEDQNFFKIWLRAKYAETIREHKKDGGNRDFEDINKFHRWVRDNKTRIGLNTTQDFHDFIMQRINRFAGHYIKMRQASHKLIDGREEIYYNAYFGITIQYILGLAPVKLEDTWETVWKKIKLVTTFLDIYLARRMVNSRRIGNSTLQSAMFKPMKDIRDMDVSELRTYLREYLENMQDTFDAVRLFYLHGRNRRFICYMLARITAWIEQGSGNTTTFSNYMYDAKGKPLEIEHIWADKYERHMDEFDNEYEFQQYRNRFGGLVLLPRGTNQSYGAAAYEDKVEHYLKENLLAASLHPQTYEKNPNFTNFVSRSGLPFRSHEQFKKADMDARQALYRQICEKIWDPARLG